jgi:CheY-like chemotaxis protein
MKVLVAEDNGTMRIMLAGVLARWGHQAVAAADGEEAWRIMQQPDAAHCVVGLNAGIDGIELCRRFVPEKAEGRVYLYHSADIAQREEWSSPASGRSG